MKLKLFAPVLAIAFAWVAASAHEYWFEPESFFLAPNEKKAVHLYVGDGLVKDRVERAFEAQLTGMRQFLGLVERELEYIQCTETSCNVVMCCTPPSFLCVQSSFLGLDLLLQRLDVGLYLI